MRRLQRSILGVFSPRQELAAINVRCVDGVDLSVLKIRHIGVSKARMASN